MRFFSPFFVLLSVLMALTCSAQAATFVVTNTSNAATNGTCDAVGVGDGCTLREAVIAANAAAGDDVILFAASVTGAIDLNGTRLPELTGNLELRGPGAATLAIDANEQGRIFKATDITLSVSGLTLRNGNVTGDQGTGLGENGGAILINGGVLNVSDAALLNSVAFSGGAVRMENGVTATVTRSTISGNVAIGVIVGTGGGIDNRNGTLTVQSSTLSGNSAPGSGGGIYGQDAVLTVRNSTISGNNSGNSSSEGRGGGLSNAFGSMGLGTLTVENSTISGNTAFFGGGINSITPIALTLTNSTLSGNTANIRGGGLFNFFGSAVISNCTVTGNSAPDGEGGGVASFGANSTPVRVNNSIIAGNAGGDVEVIEEGNNVNSFQSDGYNIVGNGDATGKFNNTGDQVGVEPQLGALAPNGGPTQTHAIVLGGRAFNKGQTALTRDQRGISRPQAGGTDIGAFEVEFDAIESLVVTTLTDEDNATSDARVGAGTSLREAILLANSNADDSTITFAPNLTGAIVLSNSEQLPTLNSNINIRGPGADVLAVDGNAASRIFQMDGGTVNLSGLTLRNALSSGNGGALFVGGGTLTVSEAALTGNIAPSGGAMQVQAGANVTIRRSTLSGNSNSVSGGAGGAISNDGTLNIENSTVSGNRAGRFGGAIFNRADLTIESSTFSGNDGFEGGIFNNSGTLTIGNSIFNTGGAGVKNFNGSGTLNSGGNNISSDETGPDTGTNDRLNTNPQIGPLQGNGGPTQTHAIGLDSPALNTGVTTLTKDQRGIMRPQNGQDDVGAFELELPSGPNFVVTVNDDTDNGNYAPNDLSLREAIAFANSDADASVITFAVTGAITLLSALPDLSSATDLQGPGANVLAIDGGGIVRLFTVAGTTAPLSVSGLTLRNGRNTQGGAIFTNGDLSVTNCALSDNVAQGGAFVIGGAIVSGGALSVTGSTLSGNSAQNTTGTPSGGAIASFGPTTVQNSTLSGNSAGTGGAITSFSSNALTLQSCTLSGNSAPTGRAITHQGALTIRNTIVSGGAGGDNFRSDGTLTSGGFNISSDGTGANNGTTDRLNLDPLLGPLADYGGPTLTHAIGLNSPAFNTGDTALTVDQRGIARPQGGQDDIGAFELAGVPSGPNFVVTVNDDTDNGNYAANDISLREAILFANSNADASVITFASNVTGAITLTSALPFLSRNVEVQGPGAATLAIDGGGIVRHFVVIGGVTADVSGLTLRNGRASGNIENNGVNFGGSLVIFSGGTLTVDNCVVSDNVAEGGGGISSLGALTVRNSTISGNRTIGRDGAGILNGGTATIENSIISGNSSNSNGGGISNVGTLTLRNSTISGNSANSDGGGIENEFRTLTIESSTISGNSASGSGGGIENLFGTLTIESSTISGNRADSGAGISNVGTATIESSTLSGNSASGSGGGIENSSLGNVTLSNTILNRGAEGDNYSSGGGSTLTSGGFNISSDGTGANNGTTDRLNLDPLLGPLADYGGPTFTHALLAGSPAIDAGDTALTLDQRGIARPQGAADDIGAFEFDNFTPVVDPLLVNVDPPGPNDLVITDPRGSDADGDALTYTFVFAINGAIIAGETDKPNRVDLSKYTVAVGDTFTATFTANDGKVDSAPVTLTRTIAAAPIANDASGSAQAGVRSTIGPLTGTDPNGLTLRYVLLTQPTSGSAFLAGSTNNVQLYYESARGFSGADSVTFQVVNSEGRRSAPATISITVVGNNAPTASDDSATVTAGVRTAIPLTASDADGDALRYRIATAPTNGSAFLANNISGGVSLFYTSSANYSGADSVVFSVTDPSGASATGTISFTVVGNSAPTANAASLNATTGVRASVVLSGSDADGDALVRYLIMSQPSNGKAFLAGSGNNVQLYYTSNAGYSGPDSAAFTITDSTGRTSAPATVSITVSGSSSAASAIRVAPGGSGGSS